MGFSAQLQLPQPARSQTQRSVFLIEETFETECEAEHEWKSGHFVQGPG